MARRIYPASRAKKLASAGSAKVESLVSNSRIGPVDSPPIPVNCGAEHVSKARMARVLLIDDDDNLRTMLRLTLIHYGHAVIEAENGKKGLELFERVGADLVITDLVMPETEGLEVLMTLRKKQPPVKIVAMSGGGKCNAGDYLRTAKAMGAARVLAKPFSKDELMAAIDDLLPGAGSSGNSLLSPAARL